MCVQPNPLFNATPSAAAQCAGAYTPASAARAPRTGLPEASDDDSHATMGNDGALKGSEVLGAAASDARDQTIPNGRDRGTALALGAAEGQQHAAHGDFVSQEVLAQASSDGAGQAPPTGSNGDTALGRPDAGGQHAGDIEDFMSPEVLGYAERQAAAARAHSDVPVSAAALNTPPATPAGENSGMGNSQRARLNVPVSEAALVVGDGIGVSGSSEAIATAGEDCSAVGCLSPSADAQAALALGLGLNPSPSPTLETGRTGGPARPPRTPRSAMLRREGGATEGGIGAAAIGRPLRVATPVRYILMCSGECVG